MRHVSRVGQTGMMMALLVGMGFLLAGCGSSSGQSTGSANLDGTIWCSPQQHARVAVDRLGVVAVKKGKDVCLSFKSESGLYVTKVVWWNESKGIHVVEWAIAVPLSEERLAYQETEHLGHPEFPGVGGTGEVILTSDTRMTIWQLGNLSDGSAAGFTTTLEKVDAIPEIALPPTYPKP